MSDQPTTTILGLIDRVCEARFELGFQSGRTGLIAPGPLGDASGAYVDLIRTLVDAGVDIDAPIEVVS